MTLSRPVEYVAAGATAVWMPQVTLTDNSGAVAGVSVSWTGSSAMAVSASSSIASLAGGTAVSAAVTPLGAGMLTGGTACAWNGTVCAAFTAQGVDASVFQVAVVSGSGQVISAGALLGPVVVQVVDGAGHPIAGATVSVHQTVEPGVVCPVHGRCPAVAVEEQGQSSAVSDANGLVTVVPLQENGVAEVTNLAVTAGTQGFASLSLTKGW